MRPAFSDARPSVADTVSASDDSNDSGSEPYLSTSARLRASSALNPPWPPPLIVVLPPLIASRIDGADTTWVSSTNAACLPTLAEV
jgi:hypothetical protein